VSRSTSSSIILSAMLTTWGCPFQRAASSASSSAPASSATVSAWWNPAPIKAVNASCSTFWAVRESGEGDCATTMTIGLWLRTAAISALTAFANPGPRETLHNPTRPVDRA
jgi:hypothetical protein